MDYISIGSNGFAQVGRSDYYSKQDVEGKILLYRIEKEVPVPDQLIGIAWYKIKAFPHDFGEYHELCVIYDDSIIDRPYDGYEDELDDLSVLFWDFASKAEQFDCESEDISKEIRCCWEEILETSASPVKAHRIASFQL